MYYLDLSSNHSLNRNQDQILNAISVVLDWALPDEALADAISGQVGLMTGGLSD